MEHLQADLAQHQHPTDSPTRLGSRRWRQAASAGLLAVGLLSGCSQGGAAPPGPHAPVTADEVHRLQQLAQSCPAGGAKLTQYVGLDLSGSDRDATIEADRDTALHALVEKVAVCNGHVHVVGFTGSVAATKVLFDGDLAPGGPTDMARIRNVPQMVADTVTEIDATRTGATGALDPNGSDITAQYALAAEAFAQPATDGVARAFRVDLLTDGLQTVGVNLNTPDLSVATAVDLANRMPVTALPAGTAVTLSGIGRTTGTVASTAFVDALKAFHLTYCTRSIGSAQSCRAVTDFTA
ncbi:hypothetical protein ACXPWS_16310 [Mycobacterium sp. BMJ-28]